MVAAHGQSIWSNFFIIQINSNVDGKSPDAHGQSFPSNSLQNGLGIVKTVDLGRCVCCSCCHGHGHGIIKKETAAKESTPCRYVGLMGNEQLTTVN